MPRSTLDLDDLGGPVDDPRLIPGIYNYCTQRCERCRFTDRCLLFRNLQEGKGSRPDRGPLERARGAFERVYALLQAWCERQGIDFAEIQRDANSAAVAAELRKMDETRADPLQKLAERYTSAALQLVDALGRSQPLNVWPKDVREAIDAIGSLAIAVSSKIHRALSGLAVRHEELETSPVQNDWNGSAKVACLVIAESKAAWETIIAVGRAPADAPIRQIPDLLERIDRVIAERFPRAMEFVRPGFDEPEVAASRRRARRHWIRAGAEGLVRYTV